MGPSDFPAAAAKLSLVETVVRFDMLGRLLAHPGFRPRVLAFGFMQHYVAGNKTLPAAYGKAMSLPSVEELHVNDAATKATFASGIPPNLRRLSIRPNDLDLRKKEREAVRRMLAERAERARAIEVQFVLRELLLFMHDNPDPEVRFWESVPGVKIELVKEEEDFF
ncbi:hypothetical protein DFJ74DRAFT_649961 [Hyaloraphidium curvatum]|nr:hypothetical protein DFJ74DRAFT_649961 [Hyaloraphidium curvatum]